MNIYKVNNLPFNTLRKEDNILNNYVVEYLDKIIYPQIPLFDNYTRYDDKKTQLSGIDLVIDYKDTKLICDEKSAVRWAGVNNYGKPKLDSFTLEIRSKTSEDTIVDGWFVNKNLLTKFYIFIWLPEVKNNVFKTNEDIIGLDMAIVKKSDIENWIFERGWTRAKLIKKADRIMFENDRNLGPVNGIQFTFSQKLAETPVNLKLSKNTYIDLSTAFYSFRYGIKSKQSIENFDKI